jgi:hypothetical protein
MPAETQQAEAPSKPEMPAAAGSGTETSAAPTAAAEQAPSAKVTPPPPVTSEEAAAAGGKPVREVPNMRVLAPALVKPEPADTTPPAQPEAGSVPAVTAPKPSQTAALPKPKPAKPVHHAATNGHYYIQLASVGSEKVAAREWTRLQKVHPSILGARELVIEKKEIAGRGTFYRVQSGGFKSLEEARSVCNELKAKKQACLAVKR